jgi:hypothetical protein
MSTGNEPSGEKEIFIILRSIDGTEKRIGPFSTARAAAQYTYRIDSSNFMDWESNLPESEQA